MIFHLGGEIVESHVTRFDRLITDSTQIDVEFEIPDGPQVEDRAIEQARKMVEERHQSNLSRRNYSHISASLQIVTRTEIWKTYYRPPQKSPD